MAGAAAGAVAGAAAAAATMSQSVGGGGGGAGLDLAVGAEVLEGAAHVAELAVMAAGSMPGLLTQGALTFSTTIHILQSTKDGRGVDAGAADSRDPGGPTAPALGTPSRTPWILSR
jgi:hypothetical protein